MSKQWTFSALIFTTCFVQGWTDPLEQQDHCDNFCEDTGKEGNTLPPAYSLRDHNLLPIIGEQEEKNEPNDFSQENRDSDSTTISASPQESHTPSPLIEFKGGYFFFF
jgi:hypothetical protein